MDKSYSVKQLHGFIFLNNEKFFLEIRLFCTMYIDKIIFI